MLEILKYVKIIVKCIVERILVMFSINLYTTETRREIWKVLKEVFWKVLKRGNSFGVIKLLRARCSSLWGFPFCSVGDLSKVRFQINGIFCFQMNCVFFAIFRAVLCFPKIYLSPWSRLVSITSCCGASTNSIKASKKYRHTWKMPLIFHTHKDLCVRSSSF